MPTQLTGKGDSVAGYRIAVRAMDITQERIQARTSKHKGQFATARDNAYCVIELPFKYVLDKKKRP